MYFSFFPKTSYDLNKDNDPIIVTNIMKRFHIKDDVYNKVGIFYDYELQEGDRPDVVAGKYYGDVNLAWVVLYFNSMRRGIFDFPLSNDGFSNYIISEYGSISNAQDTVHHYEMIVEAGKYTETGEYKKERVLHVDSATYDTLTVDARRSVSVYDWEFERNNNRRYIRLLDRKFIPELLSEAGNIFKEQRA